MVVALRGVANYQKFVRAPYIFDVIETFNNHVVLKWRCLVTSKRYRLAA